MTRSASRSRSNFNRAQNCGPANLRAAAPIRGDRARPDLPFKEISLAVSGRAELGGLWTFAPDFLRELSDCAAVAGAAVRKS
jgi:hypothetical protein